MIAVNSHRAIVVSILLGLAPLFDGCGRRSGVQRLPVHGRVTLANGEKLSGWIAFMPARGQSGPAANTKLVEGRYQFDRSNGPTAGLKDVKVTRTPSGTRTPRSPADDKTTPKPKSAWTQSADVTDDGRYLYNFTLED